MEVVNMEKIAMSWKAIKIDPIINNKLNYNHKLKIVPTLRNMELVNMEKIAMS